MDIIETLIKLAACIINIVIIICLFKSFKRIKELKEQHQKDHYTLEHLSIKQEKVNREILENLKEIKNVKGGEIMTIEELNKELIEANEIIEDWKRSNGEIEYLPEAIYNALEANREAIIKYLKDKE